MNGRPGVPPQSVRSPCTSICRIDPANGLCEGCLRTLDEIASWGSMTDQRRREIITELRARRAMQANEAVRR